MAHSSYAGKKNPVPESASSYKGTSSLPNGAYQQIVGSPVNYPSGGVKPKGGKAPSLVPSSSPNHHFCSLLLVLLLLLPFPMVVVVHHLLAAVAVLPPNPLQLIPQGVPVVVAVEEGILIVPGNAEDLEVATVEGEEEEEEEEMVAVAAKEAEEVCANEDRQNYWRGSS
jgi:hypothetical protein